MRRTVIILIVLLALAVAGDFGARSVAQTALADQIQVSASLPDPPTVKITGFPFLAQVITGRYRAVDVTVEALPATDGLRVDGVRASFTGVHLPVSELLGSQHRNVPVDRAEATGTVAFASLDAAAAIALGAGTMTVRFSDGGEGLLGINARYTGAGGPLTVTATARIALSAHRLTLAVTRSSLDSVPAPLRSEVAGLLGMSLDLQELPLNLEPSSVTVGPGGVTVRASAANLVLPAG